MKRFLSIIIIAMLAVLCLTTTACVPKTADDAVAKLKEEGYTVTMVEIDLAGIECEITASFVDSEAEEPTTESIKIYYCVDTDFAENLEERLESELAEDSDEKVGRSGKVVYKGTKNAIKALK